MVQSPKLLPFGCMQALMGPSGAGKSTLMDILAVRKSTGTLAGSLLLDGCPATHKYAQQVAYVPQVTINLQA
jgi:ABC-type multidrug transport system ATPase subunit